MLNPLNRWFKDLPIVNYYSYLGGFLLVYFVLVWHLGKLTAGLSADEKIAQANSFSLHSIYNNPVDAPHNLLQHILVSLSHSGATSLRLASVIFALLFSFCFYKLAVSWFGRPIGFFGSFIIISIPLFVISARQASSQIMLFSPVVFMWLYVWLQKSGSRKSLAWLSLLAAAGLLAYTPGMIWWIVGSCILCRKRLIPAISNVPVLVSSVGILLATATISPLIVSLISHPANIKNLLLIPAHWADPLHILGNIGKMILALFIQTPGTNNLLLGRLPILNVLLITLLIFGVYAVYGVARNKAYALAAGVAFSILAAGINNNVYYLALGLPAISIFICAGLRYLYIEWRTIFPRNPVPKTFAFVLIGVVTVSQLYFGLRYSLVAWPRSQATKSSYVLK